MKEQILKGPGFRSVKKTPILTIDKLKKYIEAKHALFKKYLKETLEPLVEEANGQPFAMLLHDGVTMTNKLKHYSIAIQFIDKEWASNHIVAILFGRITSSLASNVVPLIKSIVKEVTGFDHDLLLGSANQNLAAMAVARSLNLETEGYTMHQSDKIGKFATGDLTRSRNHVVINAFPEGQLLISKTRDQTKLVTLKLTNRNDYIQFQQDNPDVSIKMLTLDFNNTRVASCYKLMRSNLFVQEPFSHFLFQKGVPAFLDADK